MRSGRCLLGTIQSDSHTWNLVYMQLLLEEQGFQVENLGGCTPSLGLSRAIRRERPNLIVLSTVNGHGGAQGHALLAELRANVSERLPPIVIGGRLTTSERGDVAAARDLLRAGYDAVFVGNSAVVDFTDYLRNAQAQRSVA